MQNFFGYKNTKEETNFLSFFPLYFYRKNFCAVFIFCKFSLDQFYSVTCTIHLYRFHHNVYPSHVIFFKNLPLVILQKIFFIQFSFFCKFRYLDQFYSSTLAIRLYNFLPQCLSVIRAIFKFLPLYFYRN